jgi:hypothetical protein
LTNDTDSIEDRLADLLPPVLNYKVIICTLDCYAPDIASERLTSVVYLVAGDIDDFMPRQVLLYMW